MMVNFINSDKVGPGMQLEELVSAYSTFIATMNSIDGPSRGINQSLKGGDRKKAGRAKFKGKCNNCGKLGHKYCSKPKAVQPVGNVAQKPTTEK